MPMSEGPAIHVRQALIDFLDDKLPLVELLSVITRVADRTPGFWEDCDLELREALVHFGEDPDDPDPDQTQLEIPLVELLEGMYLAN